MRLKQLNDLLREYKNTLSLRKLVKDEHRRAQRLGKFVSDLENEPDYILSSAEEFQLALLLSSMEDDLLLVKRFKNLFRSSSVFFELFSHLRTKRLIDEDNFSEIYSDDYDKIEVFHRLFCKEFQRPHFTRNILDAVLFIAKNNSPNLTEEFFGLLSRKNLLNDDALNLIKKNTEFLSFLLDVLKKLDNSKQLNAENLKFLGQCNLFNLSKLLPLLNEVEIQIDEDLFLLMSQPLSINDVADICALIIKANKRFLDMTRLKTLLNIDFHLFSYIKETLSILEEKKLINKPILEIVFTYEPWTLCKIIKLFSEKNLLDVTIFKKLEEYQFILYALYQSLTCLADFDLLSDETLALIFSNQVTEPLKKLLPNLVTHIQLNSLILRKITTYTSMELQDFAKIIEKFSEKKLLDDHRLQQLFNLSPDYYRKLFDLIISLEKHSLLNNDLVNELFRTLGAKLPMPDEDIFVVKQHTTVDLSWTEYQSLKEPFQLYVKHNTSTEPLAGGRAKISQGSESLPNGGTQYLVKTLNQGSVEDHIEKEARRETKYARLLGRKSFFFQNKNDWQVISEWQTGQALHKILKTDLLNVTLKTRLASFIPLLNDLVQLHAQFRVHGDIKCENCVLDEKTMQLKLIDFGSARKVKPKTYQIAWTSHYVDKHLNTLFHPTSQYSFCDDMYALGIVVASLFPELYTVKLDKSNTEVLVCKPVSSWSSEEMAISYMVSSMLSMERKARCTSQMALCYIEAVLNDFENLNEKSLEEILAKSLSKKECSFEDILHDHSISL